MNRIRLLKPIIASCAALALSTACVLAAPVTLDGKTLRMSTYTEAGRTYVPVRDLYETMGCTVDWDEGLRAAVITTQAGERIHIREGHYGIADGERWISADTPNRIRGGKLFTPVRPAAKSLDYAVQWTGADVRLTRGDGRNGYTADELYWLARIIYAEAGGESMEGMIAVGNTILNRVKSEDYPDTIYGVIFDRKYAVQYEPVLNGTIYNEPSAKACEAAKRCLEGENVVGESLFFLNPAQAASFWIVNNRKFLRTIGNHDFYL